MRNLNTIFLVLADLVAAQLALRFVAWRSNPIEAASIGQATLTLSIGLLLINAAFGLYSQKMSFNSDGAYGRVFAAINTLIPIYLVALGFGLHGPSTAPELVSIWLALQVGLIVERMLMRRLHVLQMRSPRLRQRGLLMGATTEGLELASLWQSEPNSGIDIVGFVDDRPDINLPDYPLVSSCDGIRELIQKGEIDFFLVSDPEVLRRLIKEDETIMTELSKVDICFTTGLSEMLASSVSVIEAGLTPIMVLDKRRARGVHLFAKNVIDYCATLIFVAIFTPLLLLVALLVRLESPGPIIHRRRAVGMHGKPFDMLKFRSMYIDADSRLTEDHRRQLAENWKIRGDDPRVTKVGKFLRKTSIDELPQLFNVLLGEMSLVGPRPTVLSEQYIFGKYRHMRSTVKPGITGQWQVSGRSDLSLNDWVLLDVYYVRNFTIWLDLKILLKTLPALLAKRGAY